MTEYDYRLAIEAAKADPDYFQPFERFTIRRLPDAISVDTPRKSESYPLSVDTDALNRRLTDYRSPGTSGQ